MNLASSPDARGRPVPVRSARTPARRPARGWRRNWIPHEHGAWAMLVLPVLAGVVRSGGALLQVPAAVGWVAAYAAFEVAARRHVARRPGPLTAPLLTYAATALVCAAIVVVARPDVLVWAPAFVPSLVVGIVAIRRRRERSLVNDLALMAAACLFGLVVYQLGYHPGGAIAVGWTAMAVICVALFSYFAGTALYVKTLIRERASAAYRRASVGYHALVALAWGVVAFWPARPLGVGRRSCLLLAALFALLTLRAALLAGRRVAPWRIGLGELAACLALLGIVLTWR